MDEAQVEAAFRKVIETYTDAIVKPFRMVITKLAEAVIRRTDRDKAKRKAAPRIRRVLLKRWAKQKKTILKNEKLNELFRVREAAAPEVIALITQLLLPSATERALSGLVGKGEVSMFDSAIRLVFVAGATSIAKQIEQAIEGLDLAADEKRWIKERGFEKLAKDVDRVTREVLRREISDAYAKGATYEQLVARIKKTGAFSEKRARLIASTELNYAYNEGGFTVAMKTGARWKRWDPLGVNVCPICLANEAESFIPLDQVFSSGNRIPPAHPNCECVAEFSYLTRAVEPDAPIT